MNVLLVYNYNNFQRFRRDHITTVYASDYTSTVYKYDEEVYGKYRFGVPTVRFCVQPVNLLLQPLLNWFF